MRRETAKIFARAKIKLVWLDCGQNCGPPGEQHHKVRVEIRRRLSVVFEAQLGDMACVFAAPGQTPGPAVYVSRESVEEFIGRSKSSFPPILARALGRVLAHELSHCFLRFSGHTRRGILKARFSRRELTESIPKEFQFTKEQSRLMQSYATALTELRRRTGHIAIE
jgi:hypothetical protein